MANRNVPLPPGYRSQFHEILDSTNSEALRRGNAGEQGGLWIWALAQTGGRGRLGRVWKSQTGNLFASLLLRPECETTSAAQLAFVAGLALHSAAKDLAGDDAGPKFHLKWPNDLLCDDRKIGGILLESQNETARGLTVVMGMGLNLASYPDHTDYPATSLSHHGIDADPARALEHLALACDKWLGVWGNGGGFADIRTAWMKAALPAGSAIRVKLADEAVTGAFQGIDDTGALILVTDGGVKKRVTTGDVFPLYQEGTRHKHLSLDAKKPT